MYRGSYLFDRHSTIEKRVCTEPAQERSLSSPLSANQCSRVQASARWAGAFFNCRSNQSSLPKLKSFRNQSECTWQKVNKQACQLLQARSDSRYIYFKQKINTLLLRPNVAEVLGNYELARQSRQYTLEQQHEARLTFYPIERSKIIKDYQKKTKKYENVVDVQLDTQKKQIAQRMQKRSQRSMLKVKGKQNLPSNLPVKSPKGSAKNSKCNSLQKAKGKK